LELVSGRAETPNKKGETITIPHNNGTTISKKTTHKQNDDEDEGE
jgi:cGMP-dependent protein kinase